MILAKLSLAFFSFGCIPYLFHIGSEQGRILWHREKIDKLLETQNLDSESIDKLKLIQKARNYAITKLALNEKGGFVYFTKLEREEIGWNVSASDPLAFSSYTWWFPFAGTVPYKGYFNEKLALDLESDLKKEGLDTRVRVIGGYSTLGWFSDPVLSPQLKWKDHRLVGLVFHEMAHATAYLPGDTDLNESYASFVEEKGLEIYFKEMEGEDSPGLREAKKEKAFREHTFKLLSNYASKLEQVYKSSLTRDEKLKEKQKIIANFKEEVLSQKLVPEKKAEEFRKRDWNNEDFLGVLRYHSGSESFERIFQKVNRDFRAFHSEVKKIFDLSPDDRKAFLQP
jgi:predicted aminopeptidase